MNENLWFTADKEFVYNESSNLYENDEFVLMTGRIYNDNGVSHDYSENTDKYIIYDKKGDTTWITSLVISNKIVTGLSNLPPEQAYSRENLSKIKSFESYIGAWLPEPATVIFLDNTTSTL